MPVTKDIGGGNQLLDVSGLERDVLSDATKQLGLVDLVNKVNAAPVELKIKQIDAALKGNELLMMDVANEKARADLISAKNQEARAQAKFQSEALLGIHDAFAQDFDLGNVMLQRLVPGAMAKKKEDGTVAIAIPTAQGVKAFAIDPQKVADPKERLSIETQRRTEWEKAGQAYSTVNGQFKAMQELSKLGTGQADIGIVYAYNKILDPGSRVTQNEVLSAEKAPNLPTELLNRYNRALQDGGPIFGPVGSRTRADFVSAARQIHDSTRDTLIAQGQGYYEEAQRSRLDPRNILIPMGDVSYKNYLPQEPAGPASLPSNLTSQPIVPGADRKGGPRPQEAGILSTGAPQSVAPQVPTMTLDQLTQKAMQSLLTPTGGRRGQPR